MARVNEKTLTCAVLINTIMFFLCKLLVAGNKRYLPIHGELREDWVYTEVISFLAIVYQNSVYIMRVKMVTTMFPEVGDKIMSTSPWLNTHRVLRGGFNM